VKLATTTKCCILLFIFAAAAWTIAAQKAYDAGASDTEIKIGNIMTYTGWAQQYGAIGRAEAAYFQMINDRGGVNGRKITFVSLDSGSSADKAMDLARKLVEQEKVLLIFGTIGTDTNLDTRTYLNDQKIPQLFLDSSSSLFNDPAHYPWTMPFAATFKTEGEAYARYVLQNKPNAKIAILSPDDDTGRDYVSGVHDGLGAKASAMIAKEVSYKSSDTSLDSQIAALKTSGADVFLNFAIGPFSTQAIRGAYDADWHPLQMIPSASLSTAAFIEPAGLEKAQGIITNARSKGWLRPSEWGDPDVQAFLEWMKKYNPQANIRDQNNVAGYERAELMVEVLKKCGDNLTRANVMKQASHLDTELGMLRPGIRVTTSPTNYQPIHQLFLMQFEGRGWQPFGGIIDANKLGE
jgi:branched-chain amino acid transport system substrate-binding protein